MSSGIRFYVVNITKCIISFLSIQLQIFSFKSIFYFFILMFDIFREIIPLEAMKKISYFYFVVVGQIKTIVDVIVNLFKKILSKLHYLL